MNYLLLGGAGFIGSHLAKRLMSRGHFVDVVDNLATSSPPVYASRFHNKDIRCADLSALVAKADVVYHLASSVGVKHIDDDPAHALQNNVEVMNKLIPLFDFYKPKVIFSSTSEIYGEGPFSELDNASIGPSTTLRWGYAASKLLTEFMFRASNFPYAIVRFFNVTGPGQLGDHGMVLPRFIEAAKNNKPLIVYGDGNQVRSFCHINDALDALDIVEGTCDEIFNVGAHERVTMLGLARMVIEEAKSNSEIRLVPYHEEFSEHHDDIRYRVPDISKLRSYGYDPKHDLRQIIKDMLK